MRKSRYQPTSSESSPGVAPSRKRLRESPARNVSAKIVVEKPPIEDIANHLRKLALFFQSTGRAFILTEDRKRDIKNLDSFLVYINDSLAQAKPLTSEFANEFNTWANAEEQQQDSDKISYLLHNSVVVKEKTNIPPLVSLFVNLILDKLLEHPKLKPKSIAMAILSAGKLAKNFFLKKGRLSAQTITKLLDKLSDPTNCDPQAIANAVLGAGYLAQANCLEGQLTGEITTLLDKLSQLHNYNAQNLANAVLSAGYLAKAKRLKEQVRGEIITTLLQKLSKSDNYTSQHLANPILGAGYLAKANRLEGQITGKIIITLLQKLAQSRNYASQELANAILGAGYLAKAKRLERQVTGEITIVLDKLSQFHNCNAQNLANAILGAGYLAKAKRLKEQITGKIIITLLQKLAQSRNYTPQNLANAILGAGYLAKDDRLNGEVPAKKITTLLQKLAQSRNYTAQHLANAILGAGYLAKAKHLEGQVTGEITTLLQKLLDQSDNNYTSRQIAAALLGAGYLAKADCLNEKVPAKKITRLLQKLLDQSDNYNSQEIANALLGAGYLAKADCLDGPVTGKIIITLLQKLTQSSNYTPQQLSNALLGAGYLAKANRLERPVTGEIITTLLQKLAQSSHYTAQHLANAILGAGYLAKANRLEGQVTGEMTTLLDKLRDSQNCNSQATANALLGAGYLAKADRLNEKVPAKKITILLQKLAQSHNCNSQEITNALLGVSYLAKAGRLNKKMPAKKIITLLQKVSQSDNHTFQNLGIAAFSIGSLVKAEILEITSLNDLKQVVSSLVAKSNNTTIVGDHASFARQTLFCLRTLKYDDFAPDLLCDLIRKALFPSPYLNPTEAIKALELISICRNTILDSPQIKELFSEIIVSLSRLPKKAGTFLRDRFPTSIQDNLDNIGFNLGQKNENQQEWFTAFFNCFFTCQQEPLTRTDPIAAPQIENKTNEATDTESETETGIEIPFVGPSAATEIENDTTGTEIETGTDIEIPFVGPSAATEIENDTTDTEIETEIAAPQIENKTNEATDTESETETDIEIAFVGPSAATEPAAHIRSSTFLRPNNGPSSRSSRSLPSIPISTPAAHPPRPREFPDQPHSTAQQIFDLIKVDRIEELEQLLDYHPVRHIHENYSGSRNSRTEPSHSRGAVMPTTPQATPSPVDDAVKFFFGNISEEDFAVLLRKEGIHSSLLVLVHACKRHTFYELARSTTFRQFYHMPSAELKKTIAKLMHPLMLHRDHRALLNAIDAITLHPAYFAEHNTLYSIQLDLLNEAIDFHTRCDHYKVLQFLEKKKEDLENTLGIIEDPQDEENNLGIDDVEIDEPEVDEPEVDEPEVDEPEVDEPEVDEPEVDEPEVDNANFNTPTRPVVKFAGDDNEDDSIDLSAIIAGHRIQTTSSISNLPSIFNTRRNLAVSSAIDDNALASSSPRYPR